MEMTSQGTFYFSFIVSKYVFRSKRSRWGSDSSKEPPKTPSGGIDLRAKLSRTNKRAEEKQKRIERAKESIDKYNQKQMEMKNQRFNDRGGFNQRGGRGRGRGGYQRGGHNNQGYGHQGYNQGYNQGGYGHGGYNQGGYNQGGFNQGGFQQQQQQGKFPIVSRQNSVAFYTELFRHEPNGYDDANASYATNYDGFPATK